MDIFDIYTHTLLIVGTENLIMGLTLLLTYSKDRTRNPKYLLGIRLMGLAMLLIAIINYSEFFLSLPTEYSIFTTLSITILASSIQLFLLFYSYIALIDTNYITLKKALIEILLIAIFTIPPFFVNIQVQPSVFYWLFYTSITYYCIKYIINIIAYRKIFKKAQSELQNYYSDENKQILSWIQYTFRLVLVIGLISVVVPLTNYLILILYQLFIFVSYLYIYWKVVHYDFIFNNIEASISKEDQYRESKDKDAPNAENEDEAGHIFSLKKWESAKHYVTPGITIEDVAAQLKTNRNRLSLYLNSELNMNFYEWISKLRIEEAQEMLINTNLPIAEIAQAVGIEDRSNFDKLFKRIVGISPANYRIQHAKKALENT